MFADLGIKSLRYPALWERISPTDPAERDFSWTDERLAELQRLGVNPIVGLTHHGSGPAYTSLVSNSFATGLAHHARAVAERYPWVRDWTPVNEPLTTARFSCLYGYWYPHATDEAACWLALLNQIDATRLAMREIRKINPAARLVQTEDLGYAHSTVQAADQAAYENERRWLTWDLLAGTVVPGHPLWDRLARHGFAERLHAIADDPCPADVIGMNTYLSSERFIDHRIERYPDVPQSADAAKPCVNVDALRTVAEGPLGPEALLQQVWARYGATIAITECHNGCTREEQMRWFERVWRAAERARASGADVVAVTAWSLLGAYDWNKLVTTDAGHYECGVFDLRGGTPRPTAMSELLKALASGRPLPHQETLAMPGWWERPDRFTHEPTRTRQATPAVIGHAKPDIAARPILITGRTGTLGQVLAKACELRGLPYVLTDRSMLAIDDARSVDAAMARIEPSAVVNTAGLACIERGEADPATCLSANAVGAELLAGACAQHGIPLVTFSCDQVFDGSTGGYREGDSHNPTNAVGRSKAEAERRVLARTDRALIIRSAAFFSPTNRTNFAARLLSSLRAGLPFEASANERVSPTYLPDLAHAVFDLLIDRELGVWHVANDGDGVSWDDFARRLACAADLPDNLVATGECDPGTPVRDTSLRSDRGVLLGHLDQALERFVAEHVTLITADTIGKAAA